MGILRAGERSPSEVAAPGINVDMYNGVAESYKGSNLKEVFCDMHVVENGPAYESNERADAMASFGPRANVIAPLNPDLASMDNISSSWVTKGTEGFMAFCFRASMVMECLNKSGVKCCPS